MPHRLPISAEDCLRVEFALRLYHVQYPRDDGQPCCPPKPAKCLAEDSKGAHPPSGAFQLTQGRNSATKVSVRLIEDHLLWSVFSSRHVPGPLTTAVTLGPCVVVGVPNVLAGAKPPQTPAGRKRWGERPNGPLRGSDSGHSGIGGGKFIAGELCTTRPDTLMHSALN